MSLWELFSKGGPLMWPILICSVLAMAIAVERAIYFLGRRLNLRAFTERINEALKRGDVDEARKLAAAERSPVAAVAGQYVAHLTSDLAARENVLTREVAVGMAESRARLRGLEIIAQVAPLVGLLGTVTGMISAFHDLQSAGGAANPAILAGGIWNALLTTAFGLSVAIPTMLAHHHFDGRVERIEEQIQYVLSILNETAAAGVPGVGAVEPVTVQADARASEAVGSR